MFCSEGNLRPDQRSLPSADRGLLRDAAVAMPTEVPRSRAATRAVGTVRFASHERTRAGRRAQRRREDGGHARCRTAEHVRPNGRVSGIVSRARALARPSSHARRRSDRRRRRDPRRGARDRGRPLRHVGASRPLARARSDRASLIGRARDSGRKSGGAIAHADARMSFAIRSGRDRLGRDQFGRT